MATPTALPPSALHQHCKYFIVTILYSCVFIQVEPGKPGAEVPRNKLYQHRPQIAQASFCVSSMQRKLPPRPVRQNVSQQWHPGMAPYPMAPSNGALPWHLTTWRPAKAPRPIRQRVHPPNGAQQRHHVQSANVCTHPNVA